jgi:alpha-mannosidase
VDGPEAAVRQTYTYGASTLTQTVTLGAGSRRVDLVTEVDWAETGRMLRTSFPLAVHASEVTCEIQFGAVKRPTHRNTSWDVARDEICAHKWVDLSERGWGVALLNDCKYGHKAQGNVLDLNLLRSPSWPDPRADRGKHAFTYSLYPHLGDWAEGCVVRAAYELNVPLRVTSVNPGGGARPHSGSLLSVSAPNVIVESAKQAEDGSGVVVRLYEAHGATATATLEADLGYASASLVDLMEEHPEPLNGTDGKWPVALTPFQIRTVRLA